MRRCHALPALCESFLLGFTVPSKMLFAQLSVVSLPFQMTWLPILGPSSKGVVELLLIFNSP